MKKQIGILLVIAAFTLAVFQMYNLVQSVQTCALPTDYCEYFSSCEIQETCRLSDDVTLECLEYVDTCQQVQSLGL